MAVTVPGHTVSAISVEVGPGGHVAPAVVGSESTGHGAQRGRRFADAGRESGFENLVVDHPAAVAPPGKGLEEVEEQVVSSRYPSGHMVDPAVLIEVGLSHGGPERRKSERTATKEASLKARGV